MRGLVGIIEGFEPVASASSSFTDIKYMVADFSEHAPFAPTANELWFHLACSYADVCDAGRRIKTLRLAVTLVPQEPLLNESRLWPVALPFCIPFFPDAHAALW
jgi:hypothetical protein